ncbi:MAG: peptide chain release factor N(5)-glutamine methyltransferase [Opitutales bacterium]
MLTVRDIQARTVAFFTERGVPNPKLDGDLLIAEVLGVRRLELYLDIDRPLTAAQLDALRPLVKRRANREPLQYILGYSEFCGMRLKVTPDTLIPRPETEELVEHLRERCVKAPRSILDLGTGSGALALALAALYPDAQVTATDQSEAALDVARENARTFVPKSSIQFSQGDWFEALGPDARFDLIVANPPYLTDLEMESAEPEVAVHEPASALVAGPDGLRDLKAILARAASRLEPGGLLALETGTAQHASLDALAEKSGLRGESLKDLSGRPRFYLAREG